MGIFIGKNKLEKSLRETSDAKLQKGLEGEISVGNLLAEHLPNNTYIIAQPDTGEYQPDFLVISPLFGLRLVEVKHYSIRYINDVKSHGQIKTNYNTLSNPLGQVKKHRDVFNNFLSSNMNSLYGVDPYRMISYCVVHYGFTQTQFNYKFNRQINEWQPQQRDEFFKYHIFKDQLNENLQTHLMNASKYNHTASSLNQSQIQEILNLVQILDQEKINEEIQRDIEDEYDSLEIEPDRTSESVAEYNYKLPQSQIKKSGIITKIIVASLFIVLTVIFVAFEQGILDDFQNKSSANIDSESFSDYENEHLTVVATVVDFSYDSTSGTKFLTVSNGNESIEAVIFSDTKVPYLEVGNIYTFRGFVQEAYDGDGLELVINGVE
ncbi:NERD domain-containing protein [Allobacillus sp. GCM10007489]|uniref:NERD domain-containing protein n=1 Tax=unclassified Allobacillus TaxID=2628859 RepID=UPI001642F2A0|nr:NERD domain-containing protein [Allobacillus sp. SKP2-8]